MAKKNDAPPVTMEDVFQALEHFHTEHGLRLVLLVFPVQNDLPKARYGLAIKVHNADGRCIREITCSCTYWPSDKYTSWEGAALACIRDIQVEVEETYLPLMAYLSRKY